MELHNLSPKPSARKDRKRIGRGPGSGSGKTAGRGHKGAKSRSGYRSKRSFEGGQMPLVRRVPKRGFTNIFRIEYAIINVCQLNRFPAATEVTPELLLAEGVVSDLKGGLKVLGNGTLTTTLVVRAHRFSRKAQELIEAAGGRCEVIAS
jgi:large subunit ribosomal protein L15